MRVFVIALAVFLALLQYRLWVSDQGVREVRRLQQALQLQEGENQAQAERNRQLSAEVNDLKQGMSALEERARSELGMIGNGETFFQVVSPSTPAPPARLGPRTARAQGRRRDLPTDVGPSCPPRDGESDSAQPTSRRSASNTHPSRAVA